MHMRNLLAATAVSALLAGAVASTIPATAATAPSPANAGSVFNWGNGPAPVPEDLTGPVLSVATNDYAAGVVTLDGEVRVWGDPTLAEVTEVPTGISDATTITLGYGDVNGNAAGHNGAVLHADGRVTAWGDTEAIGQVPTDLRAKAIALQGYTGYAVRTDGTLATWGDEPIYATPVGLTGLVDVSASPTGVVALRADGTVVAWGSRNMDTIPDFGSHKVAEVSAGLGYVLARMDDGTLKAWGDFVPGGMPAFDGQSPAGRVIDVSAGSPYGAGVVTADGAVRMWGDNWNFAPRELAGKPASAVATSHYQTVAVVTAFRELTQPTLAGTPTAGQTLTATPATFSLTPDSPATGQWYADNAPIAGKTATTLVLDPAVVGESISYRTTATRGSDTVTSASTPLGPVTSAPTPPGPVAKAASSITVTAAPASAAAGTKRTVTATVTSPAGTPHRDRHVHRRQHARHVRRSLVARRPGSCLRRPSAGTRSPPRTTGTAPTPPPPRVRRRSLSPRPAAGCRAG